MNETKSGSQSFRVATSFAWKNNAHSTSERSKEYNRRRTCWFIQYTILFFHQLPSSNEIIMSTNHHIDFPLFILFIFFFQPFCLRVCCVCVCTGFPCWLMAALYPLAYLQQPWKIGTTWYCVVGFLLRMTGAIQSRKKDHHCQSVRSGDSVPNFWVSGPPPSC